MPLEKPHKSLIYPFTQYRVTHLNITFNAPMRFPYLILKQHLMSLKRDDVSSTLTFDTWIQASYTDN